MAFELKATLRLVDNLSKPMQKAVTAVNQLNSAMNKLNSTLNKTYAAQKQVNMQTTGMAKSMTSLANTYQKVNTQRKTALQQTKQMAKNNQVTANSVKALSDAEKQQFRQSLQQTRQQQQSLRQTQQSSQSTMSRMMNSIGSSLGSVVNGAYHQLNMLGQNMLTSGAMKATNIAGNGLKNIVMSGLNFEWQQQSMKSMISPTDLQKYPDLMNQFGDLSMQISRSTLYNAVDTMEMAKELYKAGMDVQAVKNGGLQQTAYLGVAGELDPETATMTMASSWNMFKDMGATPEMIANSLAVNSDISAADVSGLYYGQRQFAPTAHLYGMGYNDMNQMLGIMANNGITDQRAGTGLKYLFDYMINPKSNPGKKAMQTLGFLGTDGRSNFWNRQTDSIKSNAEIFKMFEDSYDKYAKVGKTDVYAGLLKTMFGQQAKNAAMIFGKEGLAGYQAYVDKSRGLTAENINGIKTDTGLGALQLLKNAWTEVSIRMMSVGGTSDFKHAVLELTDTIEKSIPSMVQGAGDLVQGLDGWITKLSTDPKMNTGSIIDKMSYLITKVADGVSGFINSDQGKPIVNAIGKAVATFVESTLKIMTTAVKVGVKDYMKNIASPETSAKQKLTDVGLGALLLNFITGGAIGKIGLSAVKKGGKWLFGNSFRATATTTAAGGATAASSTAGAAASAGATASKFSLSKLLGPVGEVLGLWQAGKVGSWLADKSFGLLKGGNTYTPQEFSKLSKMQQLNYRENDWIKFQNSSLMNDPIGIITKTLLSRYELNKIGADKAKIAPVTYVPTKPVPTSGVQAASKVENKTDVKTDVKQTVNPHVNIPLSVKIENQVDIAKIIGLVTAGLSGALTEAWTMGKQNEITNSTSSKGGGGSGKSTKK